MVNEPAVSPRLVLCKYLFDRALSALDSTDSYSMGVSVSLAQDAVETLLYEVGSAVDANIPPNAPFKKLWDAVNTAPKTTQSLPNRHDMESLNICRVNFKHHSNLPDDKTARRHLANAEYFLETTCSDVLGIQWADVSLADTIVSIELRDLIKAAENALNADDTQECRRQCALAYSALQTRIKTYFPKLHTGLTFNTGTPQDQVLEALMAVANHLSTEVAQVSLRLNPIDTFKFEALVPTAHVSMSSKAQFVERGPRDVSTDDLRFCIQYITNMALRFEERYGGLPE